MALTGAQCSLRSPVASFTHFVDSERTVKKAAFWHIEFENHQAWNPPKNVKLLITGVEKRGPDGEFHPEDLPVRVQLQWSPSEFHEISPTIIKHDTCDLGFLMQGAAQFTPRLYAMPNNFRGFVHKDEVVRFAVSAYADNYASKRPLIVEVAWDGQWSDGPEEMARHLVVTQVQEGH